MERASIYPGFSNRIGNYISCVAALFCFVRFSAVGGGTAGCVLANRLSEDQSKTVLLLEAGYDDTDFPEIHIPAKCSTLQKTVYDWAYKTVPQKHACKGLENQVRSLIKTSTLDRMYILLIPFNLKHIR